MNEPRPYLVAAADADATPLRALPGRQRAFQEQWLQEFLYNYPSVLPLSSIGDAFAPAIAIGLEIGGTDGLFISPAGRITIVETKLWRSPEAHRTVVAQILEYARALSTWSYQQLDEAVQADWTKRHGDRKSLYQIVRSRHRSLDIAEVEFHERVQEVLETGTFALLIVGDRIHPRATQLAEVIQAAPHLQYSIGFVELRCYRLDQDRDWPLVVFPRVVAKTREVTRAVVRVVYEKKRPEIEVVTQDDKKTGPSFTSFPEFIASLPSRVSDIFRLHIEGWIGAGLTVYWGTVGFTLRVPWQGKLRTLLDAYPTNAGILPDKRARRYNLPAKAYNAYKTSLMQSPAMSSAFASGRTYLKYENMSDDDIALLLHATDILARTIAGSTASLGQTTDQSS
jgi:hypothetical protein